MELIEILRRNKEEQIVRSKKEKQIGTARRINIETNRRKQDGIRAYTNAERTKENTQKETVSTHGISKHIKPTMKRGRMNTKLRSEIVWHRFFVVPAFTRRFRSCIAVRKLFSKTSPNFSSRFHGSVCV